MGGPGGRIQNFTYKRHYVFFFNSTGANQTYANFLSPLSLQPVTPGTAQRGSKRSESGGL